MPSSLFEESSISFGEELAGSVLSDFLSLDISALAAASICAAFAATWKSAPDGSFGANPACLMVCAFLLVSSGVFSGERSTGTDPPTAYRLPSGPLSN